MSAPPPTLAEAIEAFSGFAGDAPAGFEFFGVRTTRPPAGQGRIRMTIVPFARDSQLATLAAEAQVEVWPLGAQVFCGDPDEALEEALDAHDRRIGPFTVSPYDNVVISTYLPECEITDPIAERAPRLQALLDHVEARYLPHEQLAEWLARTRF